MTFAAPVEEAQLLSCLTEIEESLQSTLSKCGFSPEGDISTMQADHTRLTITVTSSALKRTPEKSGVL
jgi:hypothetical protein